MTGVATLFALLVGITIIYAILGVGLFGEASDRFKDFFTATWTLFITLNGESWPDFAEPLVGEFWYTTWYFGTFIVIVSVVVLNMIIAVFIEKTAEVLREQRVETLAENGKSDPRDEYDVLSILDSTTLNDGTGDFDWKDLQRCVFVLFGWESQNVISTLASRKGVQLLLTKSGFRSLSKPILEGNLLLVQSLLRTLKRDGTKQTL